MRKKLQICFFICILMMLFVPFLLAHRERDRIAEHENRYYANFPFLWEGEELNEDYIEELAEVYVEKILQHTPRAVLCQGEFCVAYQVIRKLKEKNIKVLAACSQRCVRENGNKKEVVFNFVRFREYV